MPRVSIVINITLLPILVYVISRCWQSNMAAPLWKIFNRGIKSVDLGEFASNIHWKHWSTCNDENSWSGFKVYNVNYANQEVQLTQMLTGIVVSTSVSLTVSHSWHSVGLLSLILCGRASDVSHFAVSTILDLSWLWHVSDTVSLTMDQWLSLALNLSYHCHCPKPIWLLSSTSTQLLLWLYDINELLLAVHFLFTQQWLMSWNGFKCSVF